MARMSILLCGWDDGNPRSDASVILHRFVSWAAPRIGHELNTPNTTCIVVASAARLDIEPLAVVVYFNHEAKCRVLEIGMAASTPRWATRGTIRACLHYPFVQLGCGVIVCRTARKATRTKRFLSGIGFKNCGTVPRGLGDDDLSIYAMTREQAARWLAPTGDGHAQAA